MNDASASQEIDAIVRKTTGWRGERLGQLRALIRGADPGVIEEVKWKKPSRPEGVPVKQETSEAPDGLAIRFLNVGRSEPCHNCVTHSRNQEDTEGYSGTRRRSKLSTEGHWRTRPTQVSGP